MEMIVFLNTRLPLEGMAPNERKWLAIRSQNFCLLKDTLYHKGSNDIWQRAVQHFEKEAVLHETIAMLLVGIMQETQLLRKYRIVGYGGQQL
mgnify:CR=1 FL=1